MRKGFTLVELSIVLVIIGLLIGGILIGQSLVENSKIQAQIRQLQEYKIGINNFRDKFNSLPGDSAFFSGNGNGLIEREFGNISCGFGSYFGEMKTFFSDLSASGFSKEFDNSNDLDKGYPALAIDDEIGMVATSARPDFGTVQGGVFLCLRILNVPAMPDLNAADQDGKSFPASWAAAIDLKIDDGLPLTGDFDVSNSPSSCRSSTEYSVTVADGDCRPTYAVEYYK